MKYFGPNESIGLFSRFPYLILIALSFHFLSLSLSLRPQKPKAPNSLALSLSKAKETKRTRFSLSSFSLSCRSFDPCPQHGSQRFTWWGKGNGAHGNFFFSSVQFFFLFGRYLCSILYTSLSLSLLCIWFFKWKYKKLEILCRFQKIGRLIARVSLQRDTVELVGIYYHFITTDYMVSDSLYFNSNFINLRAS